MTVRLVVVLALLLACSTPGTGVFAEENPVLRPAMDRYLEADFAAAAALFEQAAADQQLPPAVVNRARTFLATCRFALGDLEGAQQGFSDAIDADPELVLDSGEFNAEISELFARTRAQRVVAIDLEIEPAGARLIVGGVPRGISPLRSLVVLRRPLTLEASLEGYHPLATSIDPRERAAFRFRLAPRCALTLSVGDPSAPRPAAGGVNPDVARITFGVDYEGCADPSDRLLRAVLKQAGTGAEQLVLPLFLPAQSGHQVLTIPRPIAGWVPGRYWLGVLDMVGRECASTEYVIESNGR